MDLLQHYRKLFAYNRWANREMIAALRAVNTPPPTSLRRLAHVIGAEKVWLHRLRPRDVSPAVWPELTLNECEAEMATLQDAWEGFLNELSPDDLGRPITYTNSMGVEWSSAVGDVLTHALMHSAYHRGQVASDLRAAGHKPALTDFIHAVREGLIDG